MQKAYSVKANAKSYSNTETQFHVPCCGKDKVCVCVRVPTFVERPRHQFVHRDSKLHQSMFTVLSTGRHLHPQTESPAVRGQG